ncbi:MAG: PEP-CTERM sorting domain-containing protein [Phycisphaeraceae bacterium]
MKTKKAFGFATLALVSCALTTGQARATTLFSDNFDGAVGVDLNGLAPDVAPGAETWVAGESFDADGLVDDFAGSSATLAFTPQQGFIYTLDASFRNFTATANAATPVENDWLAVGFVNGQSDQVNTNSRFVSGDVNGIAWVFMRADASAGGPSRAFLGTAASGTQGNTGGIDWSDATLAGMFGADIDYRIVLDTSNGAGNWTATWFAKLAADATYTEIVSAKPLADEAIDSVGFARSNPGFTASITNFSLDAQNTASLPGDTDGDGDIDDSDLGTAFSNYTGPLPPNTGGKTAADGDTDGDGDVDDSDLGTAFSGYTGPLGPASVPEPTSLALIGLGGLLIARRRRA